VTICLLSITIIDFKWMISIEYSPFSILNFEWIHESFSKAINEISLNASSYLKIVLTKNEFLSQCWEYRIICAQPNYFEGKRFKYVGKLIWCWLHRKAKIGIWILWKIINLEATLRPLKSRFIWINDFECKIHECKGFECEDQVFDDWAFRCSEVVLIASIGQVKCASSNWAVVVCCLVLRLCINSEKDSSQNAKHHSDSIHLI
jgi:hypothetical protein